MFKEPNNYMKPIINSYNQLQTISLNNTICMDSTNSQQATKSRYTHTISQDDQLDRCQQISHIKARIKQLEKCQASTRQRKEKFLQSREERQRASRDVSLSISNNASAIFSTKNSHKIIDEQISKYENIANITQEQNNNLKQQNDYLLSKLKKMKQKQKKYIAIAEKAHKYKELYEEALEELECARQQCQVYKDKAEEMKKIALLDVGKLEDKILPFVRTLDQTQSVNSQAFSRGNGRQLREQIESKYAKQL